MAFDLGLLLAERGDRAGAEQALRAALRADPRFGAAALNLAVLVGERSPAEAASLAGRAASLAPDDPRAAWTHAYYQWKAGDRAGSRATLRALLARDPGHAEARALLAEIDADPVRRGGGGRPAPRGP